MKTLITGGTGFLGTHLVKQLLEREETGLRLLVNSQIDPALAESVEIINGSLTDPETALRACEGVERIYHLAGKVSRNPDDRRAMHEIHIDGTRILCNAARQTGVKRMVMASTSGTIAITKNG